MTNKVLNFDNLFYPYHVAPIARFSNHITYNTAIRFTLLPALLFLISFILYFLSLILLPLLVLNTFDTYSYITGYFMSLSSY